MIYLNSGTPQLAFYVNLHRAVIGPSATLTGRWRPDIDLRRMLTGSIFQIDFVVLVKVEGIQIYNWQKYDMVETSDALNIQQLGVYSFSVKFGTNVEATHSLEKVF